MPPDKGFTLIELTIVVAIIGILAAVAIPGFMSYVKSSKTSEAKTNLNAITKGAVSYYEAEHTADGSGMSMFTKVYPGCEKSADEAGTDGKFKVTTQACQTGNNRIGPIASASTVGKKNNPNDYAAQKANGSAAGKTSTGFGTAPWDKLQFNITSPFYYSYDYVSNVTVGQSKFSANATASLSEAADSVYTVSGCTNGSIGAIVEGGTANSAVLPDCT